MTTICLETIIDAPREICFDLSRNIDVHQISTKKTKEKAIAGRTTGLIEAGESVTWEAIHFGIKQKLTVKIIAMDYPNSFSDKMLKGAFKSMEHEHIFEAYGAGTKMIDIFRFAAPLGFIGKIAERLFLKNYMKFFLLERNREIKQLAEST